MECPIHLPTQNEKLLFEMDWSTMCTFSENILNIDKNNRKLSFGYSYEQKMFI
jgi:hypothetical protein